MPDRTVKWLLWQLAHANLVLAVSTAAAVYVVCLLLSIPPDPRLIAIPFLVTFAIYNFNRHTDKSEDTINHPKRVEFIKKYGKGLAIVSVFTYLIAVILSFYGGRGAQLIVMLPLITLLLYSLRWYPRNSHTARRLKEMFIIKNTVVSVAWAGSVTFLPVLYFDLPITIPAFLLFIFFFFRFFINTTVFDLRDILGDKKGEIRSIPVVLGYEKTRNVLQALNLLVGVVFLEITMLGLLPQLSLLLVFSTVYTFVYLTALKLRRDVHFICDVIVDGEYLALAVFYYLMIYWPVI